MDFVDFFPKYANISNPHFYQNLYEQKEFYDLTGPGKIKSFYHHQLIPQRFLSPWTFYQSLLLVHETGTGKSGCVAAVLDLLKHHRTSMPFIYVTNNDTLVKNFKQEILKLCPWVKSSFRDFPSENETSFFKRYRMYFTTFGSFEREIIQKIPKLLLKDMFIVLDEAHHLVTKHMKNYETIQSFLQSIPRKKLLVLTATPMRDDAIELIYLLNLVVSVPFPTGKDFVDEYLTVTKRNEVEQYSWKKTKDVEFRKKIQGHVSVFRQKIDNVTIEYQGETLGHDLFTKVFLDPMSPYQNNIYMQSWNRPEEMAAIENVEDSILYDTLYNQSIQSSLMVFPNGLQGSQGSSVYTMKENLFNSQFFRDTGLVVNPKNEEDIQHNLKTLKQYSIIYHNLIANILKAKTSKKLIYVYSERINGAGILRCINLLRQCFNFSGISSRDSASRILENPGNRYIFLQEDDIMSLLKVFNDPKNKHGDYVRVIFGTDKTTEGITLKNVQEIHVVTPGWNFGKKNQAEGRGYRLGSHEDLLSTSRKPITVHIFLHCAVPAERNDSVNVLQYIKGEIKERNILLFHYAMLIGAMDCQMNYYQNYQPQAEDNSAMCYLQPCEYKCDGITNVDITEKEIHQGNYNSYFIEATNKVIHEIKTLYFYDNRPKQLEEIFQKLQHLKFTMFQIFFALMKIISKPHQIPQPHGGFKFIVEKNDYFYLTSDRSNVIWSNNNADFDTSNLQPNFKVSYDTETMMIRCFRSEPFLQTMLKKWIHFITVDDKWNTTKMFLSFPNFIQQLMIQRYPSLSKLKNAKLNEKTETVDFPEERTTKPVQDTRRKEELEKNPYGFYGIHDKKSFKIRDIIPEESLMDKRKITKGQFVSTIEIHRLLYYIVLLNDSITDPQLRKFFPNHPASFFTEYSKMPIGNKFDTVTEKYKPLGQKSLTEPQKRMILLLLEMFSNRRQPLIDILEFLLKKHDLFLN